MIHRRLVWVAIRVWLLLLGFALVNGLFRERVLEPALGPDVAHVLSTTTLAGFVLIVSMFVFALRERSLPRRMLLAIGAFWAALTILCELGIGLARGLPAADLFRDYDVSRGRLFGLVLLAELVSPLIAGLLRPASREEP
ncbi:MAG TPA: hypothetical protein VGK26_12260 [Thermoanaerobaculia bacterium]|jgi:hypothetical protein